jgi:hypothetical protein
LSMMEHLDACADIQCPCHKRMSYKSILCEGLPTDDCPKIDLELCDFDTFLSFSLTCPDYASILNDLGSKSRSQPLLFALWVGI